MIYKLYKKQVEAWKKKFGARSKLSREASIYAFEDDLLSSRHKDTIELIEAEIERKREKRRELPTVDEYCKHCGSNAYECDCEGYNSAIDEDIAYLEEQLKLIKKGI